MNGDGKADIITRDGSGTLISWLVSNGHSNLIASYITGLGTTTSVTYKPLTDHSVYSKGSGAVYPYMDIQTPLYVVSSATIPDGIGGTRSTNYFYMAAKVHQTTSKPRGQVLT